MAVDTPTEDAPPRGFGNFIKGLEDAGMSVATGGPAPAAPQAPVSPPGGQGGSPPPPAQPSPGTAAPAAPSPQTSQEPAGQPSSPLVAKPADPAPAPKDDDEMPKRKADWDKFRKARTEAETALKADIAAREKEIATLKEQVAKAAEPPEVDLGTKTRLDALEAENKRLTEVVRELDVTQHPKFKEVWDKKVDSQIAAAKEIVGETKAADIERILRLQDKPYRREQLKAFIEDMDDDVDRGALLYAVQELDKISRDRQADIDFEKRRREANESTKESQYKEILKQRKAKFDQAVREFQDPKTGNFAFQLVPGNDAWNQKVMESIKGAEKLIFGRPTEEEIGKAAFFSQALPTVVEAYLSDQKAWAAEKASLENQIKELKGSSPGVGLPGAGAAENGGQRFEPKPGEDNFERGRRFSQDMMKAMREAAGGE